MSARRSVRALDVIAREIIELTAERRVFARSVNKLLREDLLDLVDKRVAEASAAVAAALAHLTPVDGVPLLESVGGRVGLLELERLDSFAKNEGFHEQLRTQIYDLDESLFVCTREKATAKLETFDQRLADLEEEAKQARKQAALAEVEASFT